MIATPFLKSQGVPPSALNRVNWFLLVKGLKSQSAATDDQLPQGQ